MYYIILDKKRENIISCGSKKTYENELENLGSDPEGNYVDLGGFSPMDYYKCRGELYMSPVFKQYSLTHTI